MFYHLNYHPPIQGRGIRTTVFSSILNKLRNILDRQLDEHQLQWSITIYLCTGFEPISFLVYSVWNLNPWSFPWKGNVLNQLDEPSIFCTCGGSQTHCRLRDREECNRCTAQVIKFFHITKFILHFIFVGWPELESGAAASQMQKSSNWYTTL